MPSCIFCSIRDGTVRSWLVYEDEAAIAFLDIAPATPGHTLVVSRLHGEDLWALSEDEYAAVMRCVHRVAGLLRARLVPLGLNVMQSNGSAAWQDVFHYHVHLVPRYGDDGLVPPWRPTSLSEEQLTEIQRRILG